MGRPSHGRAMPRYRGRRMPRRTVAARMPRVPSTAATGTVAARMPRGTGRSDATGTVPVDIPWHLYLYRAARRTATLYKWKGEMGPTLIGLLQESVVKYRIAGGPEVPQPRRGLPDRHLRGAVQRRQGAGHRSHLHRAAPGHARGHPRGKQPPLARSRTSPSSDARGSTCP